MWGIVNIWYIPRGSMYGIFTYIHHKNRPHVGKYIIRWSSGIWVFFNSFFFLGVSKKRDLWYWGFQILTHILISVEYSNNYIYNYIYNLIYICISYQSTSCITVIRAWLDPPLQKRPLLFAGSKGPFPRAPCQSRRTYTTVPWNWCRWFRSPGGMQWECRSFFGGPSGCPCT